jgi:hypothetical protein
MAGKIFDSLPRNPYFSVWKILAGFLCWGTKTEGYKRGQEPRTLGMKVVVFNTGAAGHDQANLGEGGREEGKRELRLGRRAHL